MRERCKKALDRFTSLAFKVLAMQKDSTNSLATNLRRTMSTSSPSDTQTMGGASGSKDVGRFASNSMIGDMPFPHFNEGINENKGVNMVAGDFDRLEDIGMDLIGWTFPDFWTFDLAGDF